MIYFFLFFCYLFFKKILLNKGHLFQNIALAQNGCGDLGSNFYIQQRQTNPDSLHHLSSPIRAVYTENANNLNKQLKHFQLIALLV